MNSRILVLTAFVFLGLTGSASAEDRDVPYWATIRDSATELNMRVGPSPDYPISWVYHRPGLPVKVIRVHQAWRLVRDPVGDEGWVASRLLSPDHGAIVIGKEPTPMRSGPSSDSRLRWRLAPGVVGVLGSCSDGWCELRVGKREGWVEASHLWGAGEP